MSDVPIFGTLAPNAGSTAPIARGPNIAKVCAAVLDQTERDGIPAGVKGSQYAVIRLDTKNTEIWNGSTWTVASGGAGGGRSERFTLSATTTDADPGNATLRISTASYATAGSYTLYVDLQEFGGTDVTAWLDSFDDLVGATKGIIRLQSAADPTKWVETLLTAWTTATGYRKLSVTYLTGPGGLSTIAGDTVLSFDQFGMSSNLNNQALSGARSIGFNEVDDTTTGSGTKNIDWTAGARHKVQGNGNATATFTAPSSPMGLQLTYTQDSTGGRTFDVSGIGIIFLDGVVWTPNPNPNSTSVLPIDFNGTNYLAYGRAADSRIITESTTARSLTLVDVGAFIENSSAGVSYTVDPNSTTALPIGTEITGVCSGGQATFIQGSGVSILKAASRNRKTAEAGSPWALKKTAINTLWLFGDLEIT